MCKSILRRVVKKIVCNNRIIDFNLQAELVVILILQVYVPVVQYENEVYSKKLLKRKESCDRHLYNWGLEKCCLR